MMIDQSINYKYQSILEDVHLSCVKYGRNISSIKLIVVTKSQPVHKIQEVIYAGARYLGENYPEETVEKKNSMLNLTEDLEWHMIGHLQSRKTQIVIDHFNMLQSLDSIKLANRLDQQLKKSGKKMSVLLQFNVSGEESKFGWDASRREQWPILLPIVNEVANLQTLKIVGLMTMPPLVDDEFESRKNFKQLRDLGEFLQSNIPELHISELSMGTSQDYRNAIAEGATMIRIGTAIMGTREQ